MNKPYSENIKYQLDQYKEILSSHEFVGHPNLFYNPEDTDRFYINPRLSLTRTKPELYTLLNHRIYLHLAKTIVGWFYRDSNVHKDGASIPCSALFFSTDFNHKQKAYDRMNGSSPEELGIFLNHILGEKHAQKELSPSQRSAS